MAMRKLDMRVLTILSELRMQLRSVESIAAQYRREHNPRVRNESIADALQRLKRRGYVDIHHTGEQSGWMVIRRKLHEVRQMVGVE